MPVLNRIAALSEEIAVWRRDLHAHPELAYEEHRTSAFVADKLASFGIDEVVTGIGRTGVVGVIHGRGDTSGKTIGLRADMDALPILEETGLPYASTSNGVMHACGHDGHTAMLLGAARHLAETRNFNGTVIVIFQPAEEGGAGAKAMLDDGLMERFGIQEVYGMHNFPDLPVGQFAIRPGALMASADRLRIDIEGLGGHAARPHKCVDPILVGSHIVAALQSIVSRSLDPAEAGVISITTFNAGRADNIIPESAVLGGTARSLNPDVRDLLERRFKEIVESVATTYGAKATATYSRDYPVTINHADQTRFAVTVAAEVVGADRVETDVAPTMGGEDFAFMLEKRPGAFIFAGNGASANLHHPKYNFDDNVIPYGASYWVRLVEKALPA
ncbi:amidohydrolase [Agaricicola taiwanensis]|uniref:Amidohydrolase n=1 Tax=Agaricicola taiwanensis TaxID=591372 RepID=A0A8J2YAL0_9RHOB|nr:M20 aminoacylase family protein [Agaricicola taiwanensis]GGE29580.1 amidohydrolase [Agaricicola taiwanensis]